MFLRICSKNEINNKNLDKKFIIVINLFCEAADRLKQQMQNTKIINGKKILFIA